MTYLHIHVIFLLVGLHSGSDVQLNIQYESIKNFADGFNKHLTGYKIGIVKSDSQHMIYGGKGYYRITTIVLDLGQPISRYAYLFFCEPSLLTITAFLIDLIFYLLYVFNI